MDYRHETQCKRLSEIRHERVFQNKPVEVNVCINPYDDTSRTLFNQWSLSADIVKRLECIKDKNRPQSLDSVWNESFCMAIGLLPEARYYEACCWSEYQDYYAMRKHHD